jgi:hypothetical protein
MDVLSHILDVLLSERQDETKALNEENEVPILCREVFFTFRKQESNSTEL